MENNIFLNLKNEFNNEEGINFNLFNLNQFRFCENLKLKLFNDEKIVKLINEIKSLSNSEFNESNIKCLPCDNTMLGGYNPRSQLVVLCKNKLLDEAEVKNTLTHELIHVFDFYKNKLDFNNCESIVCTEIRAANLTEDCSLANELARLKSPFGNYKERCIKRRSILSAEYTSACGSVKNTENAYEKVFRRCLNDYEPFNDHPKNYNI